MKRVLKHKREHKDKKPKARLPDTKERASVYEDVFAFVHECISFSEHEDLQEVLNLIQDLHIARQKSGNEEFIRVFEELKKLK